MADEHDGSIDPQAKSLDERLRQARQRISPAVEAASAETVADNALTGAAFRMGTELVAALAVGVGAGFLIDHWLGTRPWGLIIMFMLGAAAGVMNVYRAVNRMGSAPGFAAQKKQMKKD